MTNDEAIGILTHLRDDLPLSKNYVDCFDMAISALEKQEGKKPREERFNYGAQGEYNRQYYCPCCNKWLAQKDIFGWFPYKPWMYCECGQRIDWSDERGADDMEDG